MSRARLGKIINVQWHRKKTRFLTCRTAPLALRAVGVCVTWHDAAIARHQRGRGVPPHCNARHPVDVFGAAGRVRHMAARAGRLGRARVHAADDARVVVIAVGVLDRKTHARADRVLLHRLAVGVHALALQHVETPVSVVEFPLCLSRACLGKSSCFVRNVSE